MSVVVIFSIAPGEIGTYLGLTGEIISAADAIYANLADVYIPTSALNELMNMLTHTQEADVRVAIREFARQFREEVNPSA